LALWITDPHQGMGTWLRWYSNCATTSRPWVQNSVPHTQKEDPYYHAIILLLVLVYWLTLCMSLNSIFLQILFILSSFPVSFTFFVCVCVLLGFELRAYTLNHPTRPFLCFRYFWDRVSRNYLLGLTLNHDPPDLCLLSS
jgi:hypothetical protein